jgi:hypothetical protein
MSDLDGKIAASQGRLTEWMAQVQRPAILSSFGKESMVQTHLTREMGLRLPIVYHRNHWFPEKNAFADEVIQLWQLEAHDWPPSECGIKVHDTIHGEPGTAGTTPAGVIQTVSRYQIGPDIGMDVPNGILEPIDGEPFLCGVIDILERPKGTFFHPWDLYLSGHKSCDEDIFEGPCPLRTDFQPIDNGPATAFPLRHWSNDDVWDYLERFDVPIQRNRYDVANRCEWPDKRYNNDYVEACTRCIDPRQPAIVYCPKWNRAIPNVSGRVKNLEQRDLAYLDR